MSLLESSDIEKTEDAFRHLSAGFWQAVRANASGSEIL
jgi:hypothetical protein